MKKSLTFLLFFLTAMLAHAGATLTLDEGLKVKQGETFTVNVNLTNEKAVSGIEMKISLPSGLSFVGTEEEGEMYYGEATDRSSASFSGATLNGSTLTVAFLATAAKNRIKAGSGSILTLTIKAAEDATVGIGKIKLSNMEIAYPGESPENPADAEYDCNIYNIFSITASSANEELGSVTGGGTYDSGTTATLTATATEGYHFQKWSNDVTDNPYSFVVTGAANLVASFAPNQYKMTFVLDNGEDDIAKTLDYKSELKAPENITKKGYSFTGWNPEVPTTVPLGDKTYTAQWKVNQYTMTFVLGNGEKDVVITQDYGTPLVAPEAPIRKGYTFAGWSPAVDATIPAENKTFTAQWTLGTYTISYDLNGGALAEGVTNPASYTTESESFTLNNPTYAGYTFAGWTGTDLEEPTKTVTIAKGSTGNRSYKATWTPITYTITYDLDGGALAEGVTNPESYTTESGSITLNNPTRTGYTFAGWTGTDLTEATTTVLIANGSIGNRSYKATWTVNKYKVTFKDYNDDILVAEAEYDYDSDLTNVAPDMTGKTNLDGAPFGGWNNNYTGKVPAFDVVYTAVYGGTYTLKFVVDGVTVQSGEVDYNTPITAPTSPEKEGYDFTGWKDQIGKDFNEYNGKMPAKDVTFTAQWKAKQYTITIDTDGGSAIENITADYNSVIEKPADPTKKGYRFTGWTPAFPETMPLNGASVKATWEIITYTLSYDLAGGALAEGVTNPENFTVESDGFTLNNPTKTGYTFTGWTGTDLEEPTKTVTIAKGSTENRSYKAVWTINQYTITIDTDGGSAIENITADYNSVIEKPADPTKKGYKFTGWTPAFPEKMPLNGASVKATWEIITYTLSYDLAGGALAEGVTNPENFTVESDGFTLNNPTKTGYTFAGWTGTGLEEPTKTVTIAKGSTVNRSYKAVWTINKYKVSFKDYNGDILVAEAEYDYDSDLTNVAPDMTGKTNLDGAPFGGWDNEYSGKVPAFDVVYTAVYGGTFMLKFVVDGVTVQSGEVDYNTPITAPTSPEKEGYDFKGWKDQNGKDFTEYNGKMPAKNVTFTAQWKAQQYTVTFVLNNGSENIVYTQDYGSPVVAPTDPVKKGHTFQGWTPELATTVPTHNLTYEATYQINTYNVIYMVYGEEWARDQYTYDSPIEIRQYVGTILDDFRGWQSDAEYTTMPDHDVTYVADITKLDPIVITSDMIQNINDVVYTGKAIEPTIIIKNGDLTLVEGTDYSVSYSDNIIVGTAKVTVTAIQGSCYQGSADKTFKIVKADVIIKKAPMGLNLVYTGQPQALVDAGEIEGGTILFSEDGVTYSEGIPTGTEMGDYTVYYKIIGDANHYDVGVQTLTASIKGFPVVVGAGEYVTYYSDRALKLDAAETEAKLYTVTDVNGSVATISQLSVAAANTPLLVYNNGAEAKTIVLIPTDDAPENIAVYNGFKGTLSDQQMNGSSDAKDYYVVSGEYFSLVRNAGTIKANRCWLEINKNVSQSAPRLIIGGGGEGTTGIDGVDIEDANDGNWYDLNGRKLQGKPAQKGLYIKDGKKVVVK